MPYAISPSSVIVNEGAGTVTFTVIRTGSFPAETIFVSTTQNQGSTNNGDYVGINSQGLGFALGQTSATVTVSITNDTAVESNETFGLIVQRNASDPITTFLASATFTIQDNDTAPTSYSISPGSITVNEGAGTVTFTVNRSGGLPAESIFASTVHGAANGFATNNGDYAGLLNQTVAFATGQVTATVTVSIANDAVVESNETFGLIAQRNASDPITTFLASATFTIQDNDVAQPTFSISNAGSVTEGNNAVFTVTMNGSISSPLTIWYSTLAGTASAGAGDYPATFVDQPLTFNPGGPTSQQVSIPILVEPGNPPEGNETFGVGLQSTQNGSPFASRAIAFD